MAFADQDRQRYRARRGLSRQDTPKTRKIVLNLTHLGYFALYEKRQTPSCAHRPDAWHPPRQQVSQTAGGDL